MRKFLKQIWKLRVYLRLCHSTNIYFCINFHEKQLFSSLLLKFATNRIRNVTIFLRQKSSWFGKSTDRLKFRSLFISGSSMHPGMVDSSHSQMKHNCPKCGRNYKWPSSLRFHLVNECGKEPQQKCPICAYKTKQKSNLSKHIKLVHGVMIGWSIFKSVCILSSQLSLLFYSGSFSWYASASSEPQNSLCHFSPGYFKLLSIILGVIFLSMGTPRFLLNLCQ